ncbi:helix-turn-helix transcriptional regulator [Streptomyces sp. PSRA5]|uniref:helix-turn-helix domain-containing protein n=1 Tax=Streptomyces panacea TaxID=3035064 RepID=UPI00339BF745
MSRRRNPRPAWIEARSRALGQRIAKARAERRWSQDELADRAGLDRRSLQRYENAVREPRFGDLLLIAAALDMPIDKLVREPEQRTEGQPLDGNVRDAGSPDEG